jgi:hypothetical protein
LFSKQAIDNHVGTLLNQIFFFSPFFTPRYSSSIFFLIFSPHIFFSELLRSFFAFPTKIFSYEFQDLWIATGDLVYGTFHDFLSDTVSSVLKVATCDISNLVMKKDESDSDEDKDAVREGERQGEREGEMKVMNERLRERGRESVMKEVVQDKNKRHKTAVHYSITVNSKNTGIDLLNRLKQSVSDGTFLSTLNEKSNLNIESISTLELVLISPAHTGSPTQSPFPMLLSMVSSTGVYRSAKNSFRLFCIKY